MTTTGTMENTINAELLRFAVGQRIFCGQCESKHVLDVREAVLVTLKVPGKDDRDFLMCGAKWDAVKFAMRDEAARGGWTLEILDGRELFPAAKPVPAVKTTGPLFRHDVRQADVKVGDRYEIYHGGNGYITVQVLAITKKSSFDGKRLTRFVCRNEKTGREITVKSATKFRRIG
jgi:hypothetical protein